MEKQIQVIENLLNIQEIVGKNSFNKQEIIDIETSKKDFATKEQRDTFNGIMSKITGTKKSTYYTDSVFYMVGDLVYMEQDLKTNDFYIIYNDFWEVFETKLDLDYHETKKLLRGLLEEHLKCDVSTTYWTATARWYASEEHLKYEVNTPLFS